MSRDDVRQLLGSDFEEFVKTPQSSAPTDDYRKLNLHVFYQADRRCRAIEFFSGSSVTLQGRPIVGQPAGIVISWLRTLDPSLVAVGSVAKSQKLGLSLYVPDFEDDPDEPVLSVFVTASPV